MSQHPNTGDSSVVESSFLSNGRYSQCTALDFQRFSNLLQAQVDVLSETLYYLSEEKTHQQIDDIEFENHWKLLCQFKQPEQLLDSKVFHCAKDMMSIQEAAEKSAIELDDTIRKIHSFDKFIDSHQSELLKYSIWKHYITSLKKYYEQFKEKVSKVYNMDGFINLSMKPYTMCGDFFKRPFMKISSSQIQLITNGFEKINKTSSTSNHSVTHLPIDQAEYYFKKNGSPNLNPSMEFALISLYQVLGIDTIETGLVIAMDQDKTSYLPIQISTAITGCKHEDPEQLDQECFEKQVLGVLLTCPSDGKPNNYVLTTLQNSMSEYISIDNDEVFSNPIEKGYNNLKNFLLTLPNMNRGITRKTIEFFINTPPFLLMLEWINKLSEKEKEYEALMKCSRFKTQVNNENCCVDFFSDLKSTTIRNILNVFNRIVACFKDNKNPTLNDVFKKCYPINFEYYNNKSYEMIHNDKTKLNTKIEEFTFDNSIHDGEQHDHVAINPFDDGRIQKQKQKIKQLKETLTEIIMNEGHHFIDDTINYLIRKLDEKNIEYIIQKMSVIIEEDYLLEHQQFNIDFICELFSKGLALAKKYNISQEWINLFTKFRMCSSDLNWKLLIEQYFERGWTSNPLALPKKYNEIKGAISFERTLSKEMANVIFDTKKQFKKDNTLSGRSQTTKWPTEKPIFYFKKYPEFPGLEFASTLFMRHLGMKKVPHSELFMFYDELMNEHYPVLVIESMDGDIIAKKWDNDSIFNNLENYETTLLILSSLLLNPEDQKEDNLLISNDGKYLIPIDNDRNFLPGIIYDKNLLNSTVNTSLQCKSFVFCLNEMHKPLHPKIIEFIRSFNIEIFIENWLNHLSTINELYQQLFTNDIWDQHNVKLKIEIRKEYIDNLYQKLYMLRTLLLEDPDTTPFQFLKISDPLLFKEYSLTQPKTKKALFLAVTSKYYTSSQRISRITTLNSKMLMKIQTSNVNDWEGPLGLLNHFKTLCKQNNLEIEIISKYLNEDYLEKQNEKEIIELLFNSTNILSVVSIYKFKLLNDSLFTNQYFIGKSNYIKVLDLRYCKNLTEGTLKSFQDNCTSLEYLNISGWNITKFGCYKIVKGFFTNTVEIDTTKECFPKLSRLIAKDCSYLRTVHVMQNSLICVELNECSKLESIILTSKQISILDVRKTENIISLSIDHAFESFSYLPPWCKTWRTVYELLASKPALQRGFVLEAFKQDSSVLEYAGDSLQKDREFILGAVKQNSLALKYADNSLQKDREFILEAVKQNGLALEYANKLLKQESKVVLEAVKQNGLALKYADNSLQKDREFILEAVKQNGLALEYIDVILKKDREIVLEAVKHTGHAFQYADESLKKDREFVLEAVKQTGHTFQYADESLKKDREFVLEVVKQDGSALLYADQLLTNDILEAVNSNIIFIFEKKYDIGRKLNIFTKILDYYNNIPFFEENEDFVVNRVKLQLLATSSNMFSLGCILFQLLTNDTPISYKNRTFWLICEETILPSDIEDVLNKKIDIKYEIHNILFKCISRMTQINSSKYTKLNFYFKNIILKIIKYLKNNYINGNELELILNILESDESAYLHFCEFMVNISSGNIAKAITEYEILIKKHQECECTGLHIMGAQLFIQRGDYKKFKECIDLAYNLDSNCKAVHIYNAIYYNIMDDGENLENTLHILGSKFTILTEPAIHESLLSNETVRTPNLQYNHSIKSNNNTTITNQSNNNTTHAHTDRRDDKLGITVYYYKDRGDYFHNNVKGYPLKRIIQKSRKEFNDINLEHLVDDITCKIITNESELKNQGRYTATTDEEYDQLLTENFIRNNINDNNEKNLEFTKRFDVDDVDSFEHMCKTIQSIKSPNVMEYIDFGPTGDRYFIKMPAGLFDLSYYWNKLSDKYKTISELLNIFIQITNGVIALHEHKIIHRDIKPENVICYRDKIFKLGDFEDSIISQKRDLTLEKVGTLKYIAPETFFDQESVFKYSTKIGYTLDSYSLGCLFFRLIGNNRNILNIDGKTFAQIIIQTNSNNIVHSHIDMTVKSSNMIPTNISASVINLLQKLITKKADERILPNEVLTILKSLKDNIILPDIIPKHIPNYFPILQSTCMSIIKLTFINDEPINEQAIETIGSNCLLLQYLNITGCNITKFGKYNQNPDIQRETQMNNYFANLKCLILNHCLCLEETYLHCTNVEQVKLIQCFILKSVQILSPSLKNLWLNHSPSIQYLQMQITSNPFQLQNLPYYMENSNTIRSVCKFVSELDCKEKNNFLSSLYAFNSCVKNFCACPEKYMKTEEYKAELLKEVWIEKDRWFD